MKRKLLKRKLLIILVLLAVLISLPKSVHANVQARGDKGRLTGKRPTDFYKLIREMETSTGPMGLDATIEEGTNNGGTTILETSSSNNIDVHMEKNTEFGAVAMLSCSCYGYNTSTSSMSSGNKSGVYDYYSQEFVAGMWNVLQYNNDYIYYADEKYWNKYTSTTNKIGDATLETTSLYNGTFIKENYPIFLRGINSNISRPQFAYTCIPNNVSSYRARAVVVNGTGF